MNNKINDLYDVWETSPSDQNLQALLTEVRDRVLQRYVTTLGDTAEDIAQETILKVWRALPGVDSSVKSFNKVRGDFASYCATVAKSEKRDMLKHDRLICVADDTLQKMIEGDYGSEEE